MIPKIDDLGFTRRLIHVYPQWSMYWASFWYLMSDGESTLLGGVRVTTDRNRVLACVNVYAIYPSMLNARFRRIVKTDTVAFIGVERHPETHACVVLSSNAYYMLADCTVQIALSIIAVALGIVLRSMLLELSKKKIQGETKWACVWSCILAGLFFGINRIVLAIQVLTPQWYIDCCENVVVHGEIEVYKSHLLRTPAILLLYAGVICSVLAIHAVAFVFVSQALGVRGIQNDTQIVCFRRYLHVSLWVYVAVCFGLYFVNNGYIGAIGVFYSFSITAMFCYGARTIFRELRPIVEEEVPVDERTVKRTKRLKWRIQVTTYWIYAASFLLFMASALYIGTTLATGGWRGTTVPGHVSVSAAGNNWISGSMLFYVFAIEWYILQIFKDSLARVRRWDAGRTPAFVSVSASSSTSQDSSVLSSSQCPNEAHAQPQRDSSRVEDSSRETSTSQPQREVPGSRTASSSTSQESTRKETSSKEVQMTLT